MHDLLQQANDLIILGSSSRIVGLTSAPLVESLLAVNALATIRQVKRQVEQVEPIFILNRRLHVHHGLIHLERCFNHLVNRRGS